MNEISLSDLRQMSATKLKATPTPTVVTVKTAPRAKTSTPIAVLLSHDEYLKIVNAISEAVRGRR